ncbi:hypothetical protein I7I48_07654 [Histoplasma ohiense]|nr:hypothetical protein I7I48_07654 [Histoplasma ohiense (nom. inval.)]
MLFNTGPRACLSHVIMGPWKEERWVCCTVHVLRTPYSTNKLVFVQKHPTLHTARIEIYHILVSWWITESMRSRTVIGALFYSVILFYFILFYLFFFFFLL